MNDATAKALHRILFRERVTLERVDVFNKASVYDIFMRHWLLSLAPSAITAIRRHLRVILPPCSGVLFIYFFVNLDSRRFATSFAVIWDQAADILRCLLSLETDVVRKRLQRASKKLRADNKLRTACSTPENYCVNIH